MIKALSKEEKERIMDKYSVTLSVEKTLDLVYEYEDRRFDPVRREWFGRLQKIEKKIKTM
ncbi:hypothetical protein AB2B38_008400 [Balneola sp. MJW-20]|uniref:hypothetical protein n=1 Tax=Gracilimonas aurantiaca TaxID=3234185 RepID=UPI00346511E7